MVYYYYLEHKNRHFDAYFTKSTNIFVIYFIILIYMIGF